MTNLITDRIAKLKEKQDQLATRLAALQSKAKTAERKRDTRRKIVVGAAVIAHMQFDPAFADALRAVLRKTVTRSQDIDTITDLLAQPAEAAADTR